MNLFALFAAAFPTLVAAALAIPTARSVALSIARWAALPALVVALLAPATEPTRLPWLLLDTRVGIDLTAQLFLLFTALLWLVAGVYADTYHRDDPRRVPFFAAFLLTMSGNLGVVIAQDAVTFYTAFAMMSFAAYPLVIHAGDAGALRAGRVYIAMAVLGESMLLAGLLIAARSATGLGVTEMAAGVAVSPYRDFAVGLLLAGFGVKAGALPLHVWLPLAHPVAPTAASAVLSGCMIKAGLLGWIRFLPFGEVGLPFWGALLIGLGIAAAFFGVLIGITQTDPKTTLAYSSISQMGLVNVAIGIGLARPDGWSSAHAATLAYAVHHGLAKGALFLAVGVAAATTATDRVARRLVLAGTAVAALALAGAPLTSGSVAKTYLKEIAPISPAAWPQALEWLLPLSAVGTTLLMTRFLWLLSRPAASGHHPGMERGLWVPWTFLLAAVCATIWLLPRAYELELDPPGLPYPGAIWIAIWPVVAGAMLAWAALILTRRLRFDASRLRIAAGDLLLPVEWAIGRVPRTLGYRARHPSDMITSLSSRWYGIYAHGEGRAAVGVERRITAWTTAGMLALLVAIAFVVFLMAG